MAQAQGLSQGCSKNIDQDDSLLKTPLVEELHSDSCLRVSESPLPGSFTWLMTSLRFLLVVGWKHQFLATCASSQGYSLRDGLILPDRELYEKERAMASK